MKSRGFKSAIHKKQRTLSKYYESKTFDLQGQFNRILNISVKTLDVAQHFKEMFFGIKIDNKQDFLNIKQDKLLNRREIIRQFEKKNEKFFMPSLQVKYQTKSKHSSENFEDEQPDKKIPAKARIMTNPSSPTKEDSIDNNFKRRTTKYLMPSNQSFQAIIKNKRSQLESAISKKSIKRTNTFLFNLPTKVYPKKITINQQQTNQWQDQLHQNLNMIQQTHFKGRQNIKVQKEKLSQYLNSIFMNEVITSYYKCEAYQSFKSIKLIIQDLINLTDKQCNIITFFAYDVNCDGYICEEDLYFFLERLPYTAKILEDLYFIIEFLKKNKVRSTQVNLPKKLMKKRQKTAAYTLWNDFSSDINKQQGTKVKELDKRLFPLFFKNEQEAEVLKQKVSDKKFQINFDVFNLIFAEKRPVLVQEIIQSLIEKPKSSHKEKVKTQILQQQTQKDVFSNTRSEIWKKNLARSISLKQKAKRLKEVLNEKI